MGMNTISSSRPLFGSYRNSIGSSMSDGLRLSTSLTRIPPLVTSSKMIPLRLSLVLKIASLIVAWSNMIHWVAFSFPKKFLAAGDWHGLFNSGSRELATKLKKGEIIEILHFL